MTGVGPRRRWLVGGEIGAMKKWLGVALAVALLLGVVAAVAALVPAVGYEMGLI